MVVVSLPSIRTLTKTLGLEITVLRLTLWSYQQIYQSSTFPTGTDQCLLLGRYIFHSQTSVFSTERILGTNMILLEMKLILLFGGLFDLSLLLTNNELPIQSKKQLFSYYCFSIISLVLVSDF